MNLSKIDRAVQRLEARLPIRQRQSRLDEPLRQLHQRILRHYLERGTAPKATDLGNPGDWCEQLDRLATDGIIVLDTAGAIVGAYPFTSEPREFRVTTRYGTVDAMCAFDALAVSSMFELPVSIESRCRLSGQAITIEQDRGEIRVTRPAAPLFAAIAWNAASAAGSCSATLCCEMFFIAGEKAAQDWRDEGPDDREMFDPAEAHALITAVFLPLMR